MDNATLDFELFYDLYKDAYGFSPRGHRFFDVETTDAERQVIWDDTIEELEISQEEDRKREVRMVEEFQGELRNIVELGANDEVTALRWMTDGEVFYSDQCIEHWVYNKGILFTKYGRELVKHVKSLNLVNYGETA